MTANGVRSGRLSPRDGRLGPRDLRKGDVPAEQHETRDALIATALDAHDGDPSAALGVLAGAAYEVAFRIAEKEGPPSPSRPAHGAWLAALGDLVFQPTSRILDVLATFFGVESENFRKWNGEHLDMLRERIRDAAYLFGADVTKQVRSLEARKPEQQCQPMSREEFDDAMFERRVREMHGRAWRCQPHGSNGGAQVLYFALREMLGDLADEDGQAAASFAFTIGMNLMTLGKRFQIGTYRTRAHWSNDPAEAERWNRVADKLEREYAAQDASAPVPGIPPESSVD